MKLCRLTKVLALLLALLISLTGCLDLAKIVDGGGAPDVEEGGDALPPESGEEAPTPDEEERIDLSAIPSYSGSPWVALNGNLPEFDESQYTTVSYEQYADLDSLGRCGVAVACVGVDLMPTEDRGDISSVKPTGWHSVRYNGQYLYNRCHLIGFQLSGENANRENLITGTRYFNVEGMLPFENMIADYVKETQNHVLFRVTPIYLGNNAVAHGVQMEAYSVEDGGEGVLFNVFVYNVQPGIVIDYATGESREAQAGEQEMPGMALPETDTPDADRPDADAPEGDGVQYVLNISSGVFHLPSCSSVANMKESNKQILQKTREEMVEQNYKPCTRCDP